MPFNSTSERYWPQFYNQKTQTGTFELKNKDQPYVAYKKCTSLAKKNTAIKKKD
jgi:hypothetical protein